MKSWKTTACGIIAVLMCVGTALKAMWDGDATTNPDWTLVGSTVIAALGLVLARDNDKSSEDVGAK